MEDVLKAVVEIAGGLAFLWTAWQERRHRKANPKPKKVSLGEAAGSGPFKTAPVKRRK